MGLGGSGGFLGGLLGFHVFELAEQGGFIHGFSGFCGLFFGGNGLGLGGFLLSQSEIEALQELRNSRTRIVFDRLSATLDDE